MGTRIWVPGNSPRSRDRERSEVKKLPVLPDDLRQIAAQKIRSGQARTVKQARKLACRELGITPRFSEYDGDRSPEGLLAFALSKNLHRRHLTASQKAVLALEAEKWLAEQAKQNQRAAAAQTNARLGRRHDPALAPPAKKDAHTDGHPSTRPASLAVVAASPPDAVSEDHHKTLPEIFPEASGSNPHTREARSQAAALVGTNPRYVSDVKRIEKQAPELLSDVRAGRLTLPEARKILALPDDLRRIAIEKIRSGQARTVKQARKLAYRGALSNGSRGTAHHATEARRSCGLAFGERRRRAVFLRRKLRTSHANRPAKGAGPAPARQPSLSCPLGRVA